MNNMSNRFTATSTDPTNRFSATPINPNLTFSIDRELSNGLSERFGVLSIAVELPQYDIGIIVSQNKDGYVYGTDVNKKAILSKYWDRNNQVIESMIESTQSPKELVKVAVLVLNTFINDMDEKTLNYLRNCAA